MSINYLDTVTMYYPCPFDIVRLFTVHWILDKRDKDSNLHHFCVKTPYTFVRYYPNMYGVRRLYVTFSLPKLYHHCNNNTFNVVDYDNQTFMNILQEELGGVLDVSQLQTQLKDWQPSRNDFFLMRSINPSDRKEYLYGYGRRSYRGNGAVTYLNTNYLVANKNSKNPSIVKENIIRQ